MDIAAFKKIIDDLVKNGQGDDAVKTLVEIAIETLKMLSTLSLTHLKNKQQCINILKFLLTELDPEQAISCSNLGILLASESQYEEALPYLDKACSLITDTPVHNNKGVLLGSLRRFDEAIEHYQKYLQHFPNCPDMRHNLGIYLAKIGKLEESWMEMEWRLEALPKIIEFRKRFNKPDWHGEEVDKLLIYNEQGIGDLIQWIRYIPQIKAKKIYLECQDECANLLQTVLSHRITIIPRKTTKTSKDEPYAHELPEYDKVVSICSLNYIFKTKFETICGEPYLNIPHQLNKHFNNRKFKVGIIWLGGDQHPNDAYRSCTLMDFLPLVDEKIQLYSLQKGNMIRRIAKKGKINTAEGNIPIIDLAPELNSYLDTAQVIKELDLIISVDTAVAHLAGAMGKPTCLLLSYLSDWRWFTDRSDTPWYNSVKLFQQKKHFDWESVFQEVKEWIDKNMLTFTISA